MDDSDRLQADLFYADTDRAPGDSNVRKFGLIVHPPVFLISVTLILVFMLLTLVFQSTAAAVFGSIQSGIAVNAGWFYTMTMSVVLVFVVVVALSKYGSIRFGGPTANPEFSLFAWVAMLFSAGMGIGLMFFSVAEPVSHFGTPPIGETGTPATAETAMAFTYLHWGLHPWAVYALVGLGLAFFSFNRGLPLTIRSVFWPILGERIYGWPGHLVDTLAVFATIFGLATSLGIGAGQINAGLNTISAQFTPTTVPVGTGIQIALITAITAVAVLSVSVGLDRGVRRLSELNVYLMLLLMGTLLVVGPTLFIVGSYFQSLGVYLQRFPEMALWTDTYAGGTWQQDWTLFYWGWWIAWSPFVGMFIARISKGRTIREFVIGVLLVPSLFSFFWMSAFGGSALWVELETDESMVGAVEADIATALFELYSFFPLAAALSVLSVILVVTFFVTSSDSGSLVVSSLTCGGLPDAGRNLRIFWALFEGAVAAVLLLGGGLAALQAAAIATGLPFAVVLLCMCGTIWMGLHREYQILHSEECRERLDEETAATLPGRPAVETADDD